MIMRGLNKVQLIGNVGGEPESKYTDQGTARTTFTVAVNRQWNDADGQHQQEVEWIPILTWGKLAEITGEYVTKGRRVYIEGRLHTHTWTTEDTGEKRYRTEVIAQEVILLDPRGGQPDQQADEPPPVPAPAPRRTTRRQPAAQTKDGSIDWEAAGL
jgi:single-strand DNA-binding protein